MLQTRCVYSGSFAPLQTNGRGVDLALNSLADDKLTAAVRWISCRGHADMAGCLCADQRPRR